jgi:hypothetical protein
VKPYDQSKIRQVVLAKASDIERVIRRELLRYGVDARTDTETAADAMRTRAERAG